MKRDNTFKGLDHNRAYEKLTGIIEELEARHGLTAEELVVISGDLLEDFVSQFGEYPKATYLTRLANLLLRDELKNRDRLKIRKSEYPILSSTQIRFRDRREKPLETNKMDYFTTKYVLNLGSTYKKRTQLSE